ncbi:MAG: efflux RND transporter permease subunit [Bacteroidales bacterium]|jgi:hydrophobe/amphiphile efflux-1 (HAE1) family protein|nr:efflux RND transporter permease subunit [Bacteroidales bacterium]
MSIYETSVRKPVSTALIFIAAIILGLFSLRNLSIDMFPDMDIPTISVFTTYAGASAADIETNITELLEDNLNTVNNLKKITSTSRDNVSLISVEFEWGTNLDEASNELRDAISRVEPELPEDADKPQLFRFSMSMIPILFLSATADESYNALYKILDERIAQPLNRVDGVGAVSVSGAPVREVQVNVDPRKIEAYNLSVEQIGNLIAQENLNIPAGSMDIGSNTFSLRTEGEFTNSDQLKSLVISRSAGKDIRLSDVATIKDTIEKVTQELRLNGRLGAQIVIQKQSGANSVAIAKAIRAELPKLQKNLPPDVEVNVVLDTTENITNSINSLSETVMYAFIFVVLVVLLFLGRWRATLIIVCTIPVSLITAFIYLFATGGSLNIISLSSLSIAIGMVVDDAIVVLENISTHMDRGSSSKEASFYATNEVWLAVIATTLTLVAVFFPLTLVPGMAGIMFKQLGWIVCIVCIVSTAAAITLTPMMSALMLKSQNTNPYAGLGILFKPIDKALGKLDDAYANMLSWSVAHRGWVIVSAVVIFISSLFLLSRVPTEMFPQSDNGNMDMTVELPQGVGLDYTREIAAKIQEDFSAKYPEIEALISSAGAAGSNSNIFESMGKNGSNIINYTVVLKDLEDRERSMFEIADEMGKDLAKIPELKDYTVYPGGNSGGMMGGASTIDVQIFGHDFDVTSKLAHELRDKIRDEVEGTRNVTISRDDMLADYQVVFDREKLAQYGLNTATAATYVRNRMSGLIASKYREQGEEYNIMVRYDEEFRKSIDEIENIVLYGPQGQAIKLKEVGKVMEHETPPTIEREDRQRLVTVSSSMYGAALGEVAVGIQKVLDETDIPQDVNVVLGGSLEDQQESFGDLMTLLLLIVMLVYIVMATQFESLREPFIIMLAVPFAFTGVFLALWITNTPLSMIALIGAIMLVGIVVKNGIVLVDFTNLLRERGLSVSQSVVAAGKSRLRPVLMTTLTTILGMVPLAVANGEGSETWKPMGIAVIGGLTFSTVLTLIVVPVIYSMFGAGRMKSERKRIAKLNAEI